MADIRGSVDHVDLSFGRRKPNCWEFMQCGREPGGRRVGEHGVCPAAVESRLDGVLGGVNAGRTCWMVAGTFCKGPPEGSFAQRFASCAECEFFKTVEAEEGPFMRHAGSLLLYLNTSERAKRDRYYRVLSNLVDPSVIAHALGDLDALRKGDERHITAFFSDMTGFSIISERLDTESLAGFLNEYLSAMTDILKEEHGTLDKYVGDAVIGIFGAPVALESDALSAARASLRMQARLTELRDDWCRRGAWCAEARSLRMRIGLSTGLAKVGFMGSPALASYTMTGPTVNLARWLERACKRYGVPILVSETTRDLIADEMVLRRVDTVRPKGGTSGETIYELLGAKGAVPPELACSAEIYEAALQLYDSGRWQAAARLFRESAALRMVHDQAVERLVRRCEKREAASAVAERLRTSRARRGGDPRRFVGWLGWAAAKLGLSRGVRATSPRRGTAD